MSDAQSNEQGVDFDRDLAVLDHIRRTHAIARPTHENPAWMHTHADLKFTLGFIDSLWKAYSSQGRQLDQLQDGVRALQERCCGSGDDLCNGCRALRALLPHRTALRVTEQQK